MPFESSMVRLLAMSGSLRGSSYCTAILQTLQEALGRDAEMDIFPLNDMPLYNEDHDDGLGPLPVAALRHAIAATDGLVIISPEYNHGVSGVLKNAVDWASRPARCSPLSGKPVLIMSASRAFHGGVRAQVQLREALLSTLARVVARPEIAFGNVQEKIIDGRLVDRASLHAAFAGIDDLITEIRAVTCRLTAVRVRPVLPHNVPERQMRVGEVEMALPAVQA